MRGTSWVWVFPWLLLLSASAALEKNARAEDFQEIHVCVRPPNVPANVERWAYSPGGTVFTASQGKFREKSRGLTIYVFDPGASVKSPALLPQPYNTLTCAPSAAALAPGPQAAPEPAKDKDRKDKGSDKSGSAAGSGDDKPAKAARDKDEPPPGTPPPIVYPKKDPEPERQHLPEEGVTTRWPTSVLPVRRHEDGDDKKGPATVLPIMTVLPIAHHAPGGGGAGTQAIADSGKSAVGSGTSTGNGVPKTALEKAAEELAFAGALANMQLNEDTKRPDGKRYGIPGGTNKDGPNNPAAQAAAGATMVVAAALSAGADGLKKKLANALKTGKAIPLREMAKVGKDAVEAFAKSEGSRVEELVLKKLGQKGVEQLGEQGGEKMARKAAAEILNKTQTIGPYEAMQRFTHKLESSYQAHHILEQKFAEALKLGSAEKIPSVILTDAEHKAITAKLAKETAAAAAERSKTKARSMLWDAYKKAYKDYPSWLEAIKPYFGKVK